MVGAIMWKTHAWVFADEECFLTYLLLMSVSLLMPIKH